MLVADDGVTHALQVRAVVKNATWLVLLRSGWILFGAVCGVNCEGKRWKSARTALLVASLWVGPGGSNTYEYR
jgi:hypothetical protein